MTATGCVETVERQPAVTSSTDDLTGLLPMPPRQALDDAPPAATVAGRAVQITTEVTRTFAGPGDLEGSGLAVRVQLTPAGAASGATFPEDVTVEAVWVTFGRLAWAPDLRSAETAEGPEGRVLVVTEGPRWATGEAVRVVARVRDRRGRATLLGAGPILIRRVSVGLGMVGGGPTGHDHHASGAS